MNEVPQNERNRVIRYICYRSAALALLLHEREEIPGLLTAAIRPSECSTQIKTLSILASSPPTITENIERWLHTTDAKRRFHIKLGYHLHVAACMGSLNV